MGLYKNTNGVLSPIAGRGKAEYGASTVRTGTVTFPSISANYFALIDVVFDEPMPDSDYLISFINGSSGWTFYDAVNITQNGFKLCAVNTSGSALSNLTVTYTAFKLYTDNEYNGLLNNQRYSTDEIDTGKTWIDGKKIYRKVVEVSGSSLKTDFTSMTLLEGVENIVHGEPYVLRSDGAWFGPTSYENFSTDMAQMLLYIGGGIIYGFCKANWGGTTITKFRAILEYTKTT